MDAALPVLLIGLVVLAGVLIVYLSWAATKRRREEFFALSVKLGLRYDIKDPFHTADLPFDLFSRGDERKVENVLSGEAAGMRVRLFDYQYTEHSTDTQGRTSSSTTRLSCTMAEIDADCPHLLVEHEGFFSSIARSLGFRDIEFESEEFNRAFKVRGDDKRFAYAMIDARMMAWLMDEGGVCRYEIVGPLVLCYGDRIKPAEYENLLEVMRRFRAHVPEVVPSLYPRGREART